MLSFRLWLESDSITVGRSGGPGVFYGTNVESPQIRKELPLSGPGILVIRGTDHDGDAGSAPLADAVSHGLVELPDDIKAALEENDVEDMTLTVDLAGLIALKRAGVSIVHFPARHNPKKIVSLDLRDSNLERLEAEFKTHLHPKGTATWIGGGHWKYGQARPK